MGEASDDLARLPGDHRAALLTRFKAGGNGAAPLEPRPTRHRGSAPQSYSQQPLWFLDKMAPGGSTYNVPAGFRVRGPLDHRALRLALADVVARHETLRTSLHEQDGEGVQRIHPVADIGVELPIIDVPDPDVAHELAETLAREPFDLGSAPLWRARLYRIAADDHLLVIVVHHIVCDGWSMGVLAHDLGRCYQARSTVGSAAALAPLAVQYADFACWQREFLSGGHEKLSGYWRDRLADAPVTELGTDRPRPTAPTYAGASQRRLVPPEIIAGVRALARTADVTPYVVYVAAFFLLMHRYTGQHDLVIGSPTASRSRVETESLIGFFVNMLALRVDVSGEPTVGELIARVHDVVQEAGEHGDLPFEQVVAAAAPPRDPARSPLFQVSFGLQNAGKELALAGLEVTSRPLDLSSSRFDLSVNATESAAGLEVQIEYSTDLFDAQTIEAFAAHYENILGGVLSDVASPIGMVAILGAAERAELIQAWNGPEIGVPDASLPELFERQVRRDPQAVAVVAGGREISYDVVNRRANQLARLLAQRGVTPGSRVALCLPRESDLIVAVLAVLKAGAAYVPLDSGNPPARMSAVLTDAAPALVLTAAEFAGHLPVDGPALLELDAVDAELAEYPDDDPAPVAAPDDVAYVIYTSGTTGKPKGVLIEHRSVVAFVAGVSDLFGLTPADRILGFASVNFDVSVFETFGALLNGARLCLARDAERLSIEDLQHLIETTGVTVTDLPPTVMALLAPERFPMLRIVFVGGEAFTAELVNRWNPGRRLYNGYGPTECTVTMVAYQCAGQWESSPPIGLPMANHVAHVVDRHLRPVPYGVAGELVVGGAGLTRGYLNEAALTAQKIVPDPFGTAPGGRLYHTGDLVKRRRDGNIVFLGRIDQQVKIRGLRIELGEIETVLAAAPDVAQVAVLPWTDDAGEKHLVAYVSPAAGAELDGRELRSQVGDLLPRYMVPAYVVVLDTLPITASGKVDRKVLPPPDEDARAGAGGAEPTTDTERVIAQEIVGPLLRMASVGIHDNFFELGGNSLQATQLMSRIRDRFGVEVGLADFFASPTVARLAGVVDVASVAALSDEELLALIEQLPQEQADALLSAENWQ